ERQGHRPRERAGDRGRRGLDLRLGRPVLLIRRRRVSSPRTSAGHGGRRGGGRNLGGGREPKRGGSAWRGARARQRRPARGQRERGRGWTGRRYGSSSPLEKAVTRAIGSQ